MYPEIKLVKYPLESERRAKKMETKQPQDKKPLNRNLIRYLVMLLILLGFSNFIFEIHLSVWELVGGWGAFSLVYFTIVTS